MFLRGFNLIFFVLQYNFDKVKNCKILKEIIRDFQTVPIIHLKKKMQIKLMVPSICSPILHIIFFSFKRNLLLTKINQLLKLRTFSESFCVVREYSFSIFKRAVMSEKNVIAFVFHLKCKYNWI